ncbi:NAD(P)-binding protein [Aspergillus ellipticus CBS 707.79]|uniref:NAD(P)-binding protein n=1 Tax=Aspergillus ellipticus CBS 707.79 TaxID=1448320 RepID=A0A319E640_9EURO|nr:NAD(P)-binding protein [Aspergillus ellipticus CBS 707.79]
MTSPAAQIILVTGANKGLGFSIIKVAAQRESPTPSNTYILCCRDVDAGQKAVEELQALGVTANIDLLELDVTNDEQITAAVKYVESTYGRLDVLINNAGALIMPSNESLPAIRQAYNDTLNLHISSVAVASIAFTPLLRKSPDPKVINITSGIASMQNVLTTKMGRHPPYGASKVGLNGLTVHMQVAENDRVQGGGENATGPRIRFYVVAPGPLKTAFNGFRGPRSPDDGAEVVVRLVADREGAFEGGSHWQFEEGDMRQVPW